MIDRPTIDLGRARILLSNDDGIHANGLKALERIARTLSGNVADTSRASFSQRLDSRSSRDRACSSL